MGEIVEFKQPSDQKTLTAAKKGITVKVGPIQRVLKSPDRELLPLLALEDPETQDFLDPVSLSPRPQRGISPEVYPL